MDRGGFRQLIRRKVGELHAVAPDRGAGAPGREGNAGGLLQRGALLHPLTLSTGYRHAKLHKLLLGVLSSQAAAPRTISVFVWIFEVDNIPFLFARILKSKTSSEVTHPHIQQHSSIL